LGDVAVFYNSEGQEIYRMQDGRKRITPTVIANDKLNAFNKAHTGSKTSVKSLQKLGTTYNTKAFSDFFDKNSKAFKADYIGSTNLKNATSVEVDGKTIDKNNLRAEATANTVLKDGVVTVGNNPATSNNSMTGADPDKPGNEPNKTGNIHLHPTEKTTTVQVDTQYGATVFTIYGGTPSSADYTEYDRSGNGSMYVMVDAKFIYLYNGSPSQTIKVPRK